MIIHGLFSEVMILHYSVKMEVGVYFSVVTSQTKTIHGIIETYENVFGYSIAKLSKKFKQ